MVWLSRKDKEPPTQFFAEAAVYIAEVFPDVIAHRALMEKLQIFLVQEWRNGQTARGAAKSLCACMTGKTVQPSPALQIIIPKRAVRAPKGEVRGQVLGEEERREPGRVAMLRAGIALAQRRAEHEEGKVARTEAKLNKARAEATQQRIRAKLTRDLAEARKYRAEESQLQAELGKEQARPRP